MSTRRTFLQGFAALPLASAPAVALAAGSPDADLIALARRVSELAQLEDDARAHECDALARYEQLEPAAVPDNCQAEFSAVWRAEMDACPTNAADAVVQVFERRAEAAANAILCRHAALVKAHGEACLRLRRETGLARAREITEDLCDKLMASAVQLSEVEAQTMPGVMAKASAFVVIQDKWQCRDDWVVDLAESVTRDVVRVGDGAYRPDRDLSEPTRWVAVPRDASRE